MKYSLQPVDDASYECSLAIFSEARVKGSRSQTHAVMATVAVIVSCREIAFAGNATLKPFAVCWIDMLVLQY